MGGIFEPFELPQIKQTVAIVDPSISLAFMTLAAYLVNTSSRYCVGRTEQGLKWADELIREVIDQP